MSTIVNSTKLSERDIINSNKLFLKIQKKKKIERLFLNLLYEAKAALITKPNKIITSKEKSKRCSSTSLVTKEM